MQFTKTLIAAALLAVAAGAQAQVSSSDLVLDVVDTSNNSTYVLDLGITAATLVSDLASNQGISATVSAATDANFSAFISAVGSDSLVYQVMGSNGYASYVATDASTTLPSDSGTAGHVSTLNSASSFIGIDIATMSSDASGTITSSLYENTIAGIFGGKINNDSVYTTDSAVGTAMNVIYMYNPSGNAISINEIGGALAADFTISGTGSAAMGSLTIGPQASAVPLPTTVWMFLSGVVGLLSLKRRKAA